MRRVSTLLRLIVLLLVSMPAMAQLDELKDKVIMLKDAATKIESGKWYVMKNGGRSAYAYSQGAGNALVCASVSKTELTGSGASEKAGYLVRFESVEGGYRLQTGLGDYWGTLTSGSNSGTVTEEAPYYTSGKITGQDDWFWFKGNNGEMQLDCNAAGGTVAGWGTSIPTGTSSNAAWQIMGVDLVDASQLIEVTVTYKYNLEGQTAYSYSSKVKGVSPMTVSFDAPATYIGASCNDQTRADETISESKTVEVVYNYTQNTSELPFALTTISNGAFAEGTKWYFLSPESQSKYCLSDDDNDGLKYASFEKTPINRRAFFTFTGNAVAGFKIYNYAKGATKSIQGDNSNTTVDVEFNEDNLTNFVMEKGTSEGQYRFRLPENSLSYLNAYEDVVSIYTEEGWSPTDEGSQYYINEVSEEVFTRAMNVLESYAINPENGSVFRNGDAIEAIAIGYGDNITFPAERKLITWMDENGNVVDTLDYEVGETPDMLMIKFGEPFNTVGNYTLVIPDSTVMGATKNSPNTETKLSYSFYNTFETKIVTARIWKSMDGYTNWPNLLYEDGKDYYKVKIQIDSQDKITLLDWENTNDSTNNLVITFDGSKTEYNGLTINGNDVSGTKYAWIDTDKLVDDGYYGAYMYGGTSNFEMNEEYGKMQLRCYSFGIGGYYYICADWYMNDYYSKEVVKGYVWNKPVAEDFDGEVAWTQLPYGKDGKYEIEVVVENDSTLTLNNYTGVVGENKTIEYDRESGNVVKIDGKEGDSYSTVLCTSTVLDGVYGSYYEYTGESSRVQYDAETKQGYICLCGLDYSVNEEGDYRYLFVAIDNTVPQADTLVATVSKTPVAGYTGEAFAQLPYGDNDSYQIKVVVDGQNVKLIDYTGVAGEVLTLNLDENGKVAKINSTAADSYGTVWVKSTVLDGTGYDGYYVYPYAEGYESISSVVILDNEKKNGCIVICGLDYSVNEEGDYRYIYITIGDGIPVAIQTVVESQRDAAIYDLSGRRLSTKPAKGLYIQGGRLILK